MYQIVKFLFPFADDFEKGKPRPSLIISPSFGKHDQVILAYITKDNQEILDTDLMIDSSKAYFIATGLKSDSVIKLHRLITVVPSQIGEAIGNLPEELIPQLQKKLQKVFQLR